MNTTLSIHTKHQGPFPCKGAIQDCGSDPHHSMTSEQVAWMKENKPLYFTGDLWLDLPHLPQHLRHV